MDNMVRGRPRTCSIVGRGPIPAGDIRDRGLMATLVRALASSSIRRRCTHHHCAAGAARHVMVQSTYDLLDSA